MRHSHPSGADYDQDGLGDGAELAASPQTNPTDTDSDDDALTDCQETGYVPQGTAPNDGTTPAVDDPPAADGRSCGGATMYHTSPRSADPDSDGKGDSVGVSTD